MKCVSLSKSLSSMRIFHYGDGKMHNTSKVDELKLNQGDRTYKLVHEKCQ